MDSNRTVNGLAVHKDSIYLCITGHDEAIIFEKTYGVLTPDLYQRCTDMVERGVTEAAMESTAVYWIPVWKELCESNLRQTLIEIAWGASRTRSCIFSNFSYTRNVIKKKSKMKIQVAIARKILVAVWHMLTTKEDFIDIYLRRLREQKELDTGTG